jgi:hypothetical protein
LTEEYTVLYFFWNAHLERRREIGGQREREIGREREREIGREREREIGRERERLKGRGKGRRSKSEVWRGGKEGVAEEEVERK